MYDFWDTKADNIRDGDNLRDVSPLTDKIKIDENQVTHYVFSKKMFYNPKFDENQVTHYVFSKKMFYNPKFSIPDDDYELFEKFLDGGSREYPSDGNVPVDVLAFETNKVLDKITEFASTINHKYCNIAREELKKNGRNGLVRGTIKLYLGFFTTRDWRRKRFTDDIDFWILNKNLLDYALVKLGWRKNSKTKEFEKIIEWKNYSTNKVESSLIIASNDTDQLLDFCNGCYLEGSTILDIFRKKIKRGHDVDLSDIINVVIVNNSDNNKVNSYWNKIWIVFEEASNIRSTRITSNIISLCRFSYGIAEYL
ncbi:MAG: hypothetical protein ACTSQD_09125, partial [Promethearchaeota archaeon]